MRDDSKDKDIDNDELELRALTKERTRSAWAARRQALAFLVLTAGVLLPIAFLTPGPCCGARRGGDDAMTSRLRAGTELAKVTLKALPIPKGPATTQHLAAPCPEATEEFNGYCYMRVLLTPEQVKAKACDSLDLYEPSEGWCRTRNAGYRPYRGTRRSGSVDPQ